jgi:hypothetical protein
MKTRSFLSTTLALGVLAVISVLPALAFVRVPQVVQSTTASATKLRGGYIKLLPGVDGTMGAAQTAIRRFTPIHGNGPSIYLVAAIHIGEKSYYKQLQRFLDKQSVVLYEGVGPPPRAIRTKFARGAGSHPFKVAKQPVGIQKKLANALNLQLQMDGIRYDRPQFRNSDLNWDTMNSLATEAGPDTQRLLAELKNSISGGPNVTEVDLIMDKVLKVSASRPLVATILRRLFVVVLCAPDKVRHLPGLKQDKGGPLGPAKKLDSIIINERNKTVLADLKALLKTSKRNSSRPIQSIAIFYGAAHMKDIEQHLVSDLGYRTAEAQWVTAIWTAH